MTFPLPPIAGTEAIQPLGSPEELIEEGRLQNNCVNSCAQEVAKGYTYIYRVLAPERATASIIPTIDGWQLGQIAAQNNSLVSADTHDAVEKWLLEAQFPPPPMEGTPAIEPIASFPDLLDELQRMDNFALPYVWHVPHGRHYFYRILEPERATIMISRCDETWQLRQISGRSNSPVSRKTWLAAER